MQKAAIYVRDPLPAPGIISKEDPGDRLPRLLPSKRPHSLSHVIDTAGIRKEFTRMISEATRDNSTFDFTVFWKLNRFSMSLEETIELRDNLRRVDTKLVSTTERGIDD